MSNADDTIEVTRYTFKCETCGFPIDFLQYSDGAQYLVRPHYYCDNPRVKLTVHNPRKLGVITGHT